MSIKQISIFIENKQGRLSLVTDILEKNNINIRALSLAETGEFGILRIIVNNPDQCVKVLKENQIVAQETEVVGFEVDDTPGGIGKVLKILSNNNINIEYIYAFVEKKGNKAFVAAKTNDVNGACKVLESNNVQTLTTDSLKSI